MISGWPVAENTSYERKSSVNWLRKTYAFDANSLKMSSFFRAVFFVQSGFCGWFTLGTKLLLTKHYSEIIIFRKLRISHAIPSKCLSFLDILRGQNASTITKNNSQGVAFVIISCQRVIVSIPDLLRILAAAFSSPFCGEKCPGKSLTNSSSLRNKNPWRTSADWPGQPFAWIFGSQNPSRIMKDNSQGVFFVMLCC